MLIKLENALIEAGYLRGEANEDHTVSVVFKLTKLGLFYICLLDDTGSNVEKREVFTRDRLKEMGDRIAEKYPQYVRDTFGLLVVLTANSSESRMKLGEDVPFWIVDVPKKNLMIYDDQPGVFLDARTIIESRLTASPWKNLFKQLKILLSPVNIGLILGCIGVFILQKILAGGDDIGQLERVGAMHSKTFFENHEYWTAVTHIFLHGSFQHLFFNMVTQLYVGKPLEVLLGKVRFVLLYLLSGIGAGMISLALYIQNGENVYSLGASGAISGMCGALLCILFLNRKRLKKVPYLRYIIFLGIVVTNGINTPGVNWMAHASGAVLGIILALLLYGIPKLRKIKAGTDETDGQIGGMGA
ncbi:MAG: rhomboid family intramembrane serine protease [Lachnospiraceae bacterium]|nr:rhomboid family intramembrane serine protease [Lachnospiraceae bacterium]